MEETHNEFLINDIKYRTRSINNINNLILAYDNELFNKKIYFGTYKNFEIKDVPKEYIDWAKNQINRNDKLKDNNSIIEKQKITLENIKKETQCYFCNKKFKIKRKYIIRKDKIEKHGIPYQVCNDCINNVKCPRCDEKLYFIEYNFCAFCSNCDSEHANNVERINFVKRNNIQPTIGNNEEIILNNIEIKDNIFIERQHPIIGYFIDGYCKKTNTAYEIDGIEHYDCEGILLEKDRLRQKSIERELKCEFIRIRI